MLESERKRKDGSLSRTELESLIDEWILGRNAYRDRRILKRRLYDGFLRKLREV